MPRLYAKKSDNGAIANKIACHWCVPIIIALMIRMSRAGGCSETMRIPGLKECHYSAVDDFFRPDAVNPWNMKPACLGIIVDDFDLSKRNGRTFPTGDGVLQPKEGRRMPGAVRLYKESGTQAKPSSFYGMHVAATKPAFEEYLGRNPPTKETGNGLSCL